MTIEITVAVEQLLFRDGAITILVKFLEGLDQILMVGRRELGDDASYCSFLQMGFRLIKYIIYIQFLILTAKDFKFDNASLRCMGDNST